MLCQPDGPSTQAPQLAPADYSQDTNWDRLDSGGVWNKLACTSVLHPEIL